MKRIQISVYFLVPFIIGMLSLLTFAVTFQVMKFAFTKTIFPGILLLIPGLLVPVLSIIAGYYVVKNNFGTF